MVPMATLTIREWLSLRECGDAILFQITQRLALRRHTLLDRERHTLLERRFSSTARLQRHTSHL